MSSVKSARPKALPRYEIVNSDAPELAQAAGLLLALLKASKASSLAELAVRYRDGTLPVQLDAEQMHLLNTHRGPLRDVRIEALDGVTVTTTLAACDTCGEHFYIAGTGGIPRNCTIRLGCTGTPVKARIARKAPPVVPAQ